MTKKHRIIINIFMEERKYELKSMSQNEKTSALKQNIEGNRTIVPIYPDYQSRSLKVSKNHLETSFELNAEIQHAQNIWKSSLEFISSCFPCDQISLSQGFNDQKIFPACSKLNSQERDLEQLIWSNKLLKQQQLQQFLFDLKSEKEFTMFLQKMSMLFNEEIFQEILYVCHQCWEKYLSFKQGTRFNSTFLNMNFSTVINFEQQIDDHSLKQFRSLTSSEIHQQTDKVLDEIAGKLFLSSQIKYINLMEAEMSKKKVQIRDEFRSFLNSIIKGVFFLLEGYYQLPNYDDQCSSMLSFEWSSKENFLQESEEYEEQELYIYSPARKLRKYQ